jgi:hypothetical protein
VEEVDVRSGTLLVLTVAGAVFWICGGEPPVLGAFVCGFFGSLFLTSQ